MVNYPHQISRKIAQVRPKKSNRVDFANRGMSFESAINATNDYYLSRGLAVIHKKPTPVQIVKVDYPKRSRAKIVEAYFRQASTTDYSGVYKGYYIDFEAKCCHSTSFSFGHIYEHQIYHLDTVEQMGGISFLIIEFPLKNEVYILPSSLLKEKYLLSLQGGRKSISYEEFKKIGYLVQKGFQPTIDFLQVVDILIEKQINKTGD